MLKVRQMASWVKLRFFGVALVEDATVAQGRSGREAAVALEEITSIFPAAPHAISFQLLMHQVE